MKNRMWVPQGMPRQSVEATRVPCDEIFTHVANHPLVSYEAIAQTTTRKIRAVGFGTEGTLLPYGEDEIDDSVMTWLDYEQLMYRGIYRFAITNCKDPDKVERWQRQLSTVNVDLYHSLGLKMPFTHFGEAVICSDPALRKPNPEIYQRAGKARIIKGRKSMAFVSSKMRDLDGATAVGYGVTVLTPRYGEADSEFYRYIRRPSQWMYMFSNSIRFGHIDEAVEAELNQKTP